MHSSPKKRCPSSSLETIAADLPILKKYRIEKPTTPFSPSILQEGPTVETTPNETLEFNFGELAHEFVSTPVPGNDINVQGFDSFFSNISLNIIPVTEEVTESSDISSDEEKLEVKGTCEQLPSQSVSAEAASAMVIPQSSRNSPNVIPIQNNDIDSNQQRQAERAARNRESSRRAREKAKNRFRSLQNDNLALHEMVRRLRAQNEHLIAQLDRAQVMQQSCPMCKYSAAMTQQPQCSLSSVPVFHQ